MENVAYKSLLAFSISQIPPKYGVILRGEWGSGKSWIAKKLIDTLVDLGDQPIYISLNGLKNIEHLSSAIYASLHPVLGGKKARIAKSVFYSLIKNSVKIDLNDFTEAKLNIDFSEVFDDEPDLTKRNVFVFDDFERSCIPIEESLGYINRIIENPSSRVICICNEDGFDEKTAKIYSSIKEKTFGKTISATPDINDALASFISEISTPEIAQHLDKIKESIIASFLDSRSNNLRVLRYSIIEWESFILAHDVKEYIQFLDSIAMVFFPLCIEFKLGNLGRGTLQNYQLSRYSRDKQKPDDFEFLTRYSTTNFFALHLENETWEDFFLTGTTSPNRLRKYLRDSGHIEQSISPPWYRGQFYTQLSAEEFSKVVSDIEFELFKNPSPKIGEYTHCIAVYLSVIQIGAIKKAIQKIIQKIIKRLNRISKTIDWELNSRHSGLSSRPGNRTPAPHGTVLDSLPSHGSSKQILPHSETFRPMME